MLCIVDGTGPWSDAVYDSTMKSGFCRSIESEVAGSSYIRGPYLLGGSIKQVAIQLIKLAFQKSEKIYLCGYSRGGASAIMLAYLMQINRTRVDGLFLFDPVDSDLTLEGTDIIPANVVTAYYARRNPDYGNLFAAEAEKQAADAAMRGIAAAKDFLSMNVVPGMPSFLPIQPSSPVQTLKSIGSFAVSTGHTISQEYKSLKWKHGVVRGIGFDNCGLSAAPGVRMIGPKLFDGTHAALGGILRDRDDFPTEALYKADQACIRDVHAWMWKNFQESGVTTKVAQSNTMVRATISA